MRSAKARPQPLPVVIKVLVRMAFRPGFTLPRSPGKINWNLICYREDLDRYANEIAPVKSVWRQAGSPG